MQMKYLRLLIIATCIAQATYAQSVYIGVFGGAAAYNGDLASKIFPKKVTNGVIGITGNYDVNPHFSIRTGLSYCVIGAADRYSDDPSLVIRNLSFETKLVELSTVGEYSLVDLDSYGFSPYVFGGLAVFKFNPYAYDTKGQKVYLKPLSTEGQGLSAYPDRKPYHLTQLAIPFGGGIKVAVNENIRMGFEIGLRKLFTEYLDDVSTNYVKLDDLLNAHGQEAVDMAYRGDELVLGPNNSILPYPTEGNQRGDPSGKDTYYFSGIHLSYFFNSAGGKTSRGGYGGKRGRMGCPTNVY